MAGLRDAFGCVVGRGAAPRRATAGVVESSAGEPVPRAPEDADVSVPLDADTTLAVSGVG